MPPTDVSDHDKRLLNTAITNMILSSLRPYEIANEPFLASLLEKALEVGARYGYKAGKQLRFCLEDTNKLISADGVR